jgi:hypothetical protein
VPEPPRMPPAQTVGAVPEPMEAPPQTPPGTEDLVNGEGGGGSEKDAGGATKSNSLLAALRGVKAPEAPQPQKISSPSVPAFRGLQDKSQIAALMMAMLGDKAAGPGAPLRLGQAIGR